MTILVFFVKHILRKCPVCAQCVPETQIGQIFWGWAVIFHEKNSKVSQIKYYSISQYLSQPVISIGKYLSLRMLFNKLIVIKILEKWSWHIKNTRTLIWMYYSTRGSPPARPSCCNTSISSARIFNTSLPLFKYSYITILLLSKQST